MSTKFKMNEKTLTNVLYIGAAVIVVTILCASIFAFVNSNRKTKIPTDTAVTTNEMNSPSTDTPVTDDGQQTITPVTETPSDIVNVKDPVTPKPVEFKKPVNGSILKSHSVDTLVYSITMNDYRAHCGVDIAASVGTPVYAVADGSVSKVYNDYLMGTCIEIDHGNGIVSCYRNLAEELPAGIGEGVKITSGQVIAGVGDTAVAEISDDSHLHFEVLKNGESVNPLDYLSYGESAEKDS